MKTNRLLVILFATSFLFLLSFSRQASSEDKPLVQNFVGTTVSEGDGIPISGVNVWIHESKGRVNLQTQSDDNGNFSIHLPDGYYDVLFSRSGCAPFCKGIWVHDGKRIELRIHLGPDMDNSQID